MHRPRARRRQAGALVELTGGQTKVARSSAFFLICGDTRRHRLLVERAGQTYEARLEAFLLAVVDTSLFAQNLVIAFESMGYGICYIGGLRNHLFEVDRIMSLPEGVYPLFGLCVGVAAEQPIARPRLPVDAVLFDEEYPDDASMLDLIDEYDGRYREYLKERDGESADRTWSDIMSAKFAATERADIGAFYRTKGADLS